MTAESGAKVRELSDFLSEGGQERLIAMLTRPSQYLVRATEVLEDKGSFIERKTSLELSSGRVAHLLPVAQPLRGTLIDTLEIEGSSSVQSSILGRRDTLTAIKILMSRAAERAGLDPADSDVAPYTLVAQLESVTAASLFNTLRQMRRIETQTSGALGKAAILAHDPSFFALFSFFRLHQLLLVPCSPDRDFFKVSYKTHIGQSRYRGHSFAERSRQALGLSPYKYRVEIPLALAAQSYHLRMRGPAQHYVRSLEVLATFLDVTQSPHSLKSWELRGFRPEGSAARILYRPKDVDNLAHLYTQQLVDAPNRPRRIVASVHFDERPPGRTGGAIARLGIVLTSIIVASFMVEGLIGSQASLVPALLVALPGALGISTLLNGGVEELAAPVPARLGSILAALASLVATFAIVSWVSSKGTCQSPDICNYSIPTDIRLALLTTEWSILVVIFWCTTTVLANYARFTRSSGGPTLA